MINNNNKSYTEILKEVGNHLRYWENVILLTILSLMEVTVAVEDWKENKTG